MTLTRYVFAETLKTFLLSLAGLSSVIFIAFTLSQLHQLQGVSLALLLQLFPSLLPEVFLITVPASLLLAVTFTTGRLAADNELNAMRASGVHLGRVLLPGLVLGAALSAASAWLVHVGVPDALYARRNLMGRALEGLASQSAAALREFRVGDLFVRFKDYHDGALIETDIFLVDSAGNRETIRAREARISLDLDEARLFFDLRDASITFQSSGKGKDVQSDIQFDSLRRDVSLGDKFKKRKRLQDMRDSEILAALREEIQTRYADEELRTEFHRRKALSAAPFVFALAAGPLAMLLKRGGRVAGLAAVVLPVFAAYFPLAIGGQRLGEGGVVPEIVGAYAADAVLSVAGLVVFRKFVLL
jgi:lipopolysaccharide export LptBFGC system permease protein LptF